MPLPAAARLIEFKRTPMADSPATELKNFSRPKPAEKPVDDTAERIEEAFFRGRIEGFQAARTEYNARMVQAEAGFEERLAAQRAQWSAEQGAGLAERIERGIEALNTDVGDAVAAILAPFVEEALRKKIVEELLRTLAKVLKGGRPASLRVSGPEDLLDSIRQALGDSASSIEFKATDAVDVRDVADHTVIETQLEAWLQRISGRDG